MPSMKVANAADKRYLGQPIEYPEGGKELSIYVETIGDEWNMGLTNGNCKECSCELELGNDDAFEPYVHCLVSRSRYITDSKRNATFIFVPMYSTLAAMSGRNNSLDSIPALVKGQDFSLWRGARHVVVDRSPKSMYFNDEHIVITTELSVRFIRENRWLNSRHILVPPLQALKEYPVLPKTREITCIGDSDEAKLFAEANNVKRLESTRVADLIPEMCVSKFTVLFANDQTYPRSLVYEIIRSRSIPVLVSDPFMAAYANTHVNYSRISVRTDASQVMKRIKAFDFDGVGTELERSAGFLTWPLDPSRVAPDNAAGVMFDYMNTRHRVLRPVLRRNFIGSDQLIWQK